MIAVADQEEALAGKVAREAIEQPGIIAEAHALAPQIFVDIGRVSRIRPFRRQVGPGDTLEMHVELQRMSARAGKGSGKALLRGKTACECDLMFVLADP